jgi:CMP-N-acetylneuraminic acid synthetase
MMISVFLPTRKGSERVINKNTREFAGINGGLLKIKLVELLNCKNVDEIILSTNDESSIKVAEILANPRIKIVLRPNHLALSETSLIDLVNYVPSVCSNENILWTHVTSPFIGSHDYDEIIEKYFNALLNGYDSLMTVKSLRNFIWDESKNDIINRVNNEKWPRTQDLKVLHEIDSGVFINSKENYKSNFDRIGKKPYLFESKGLGSFDVDWEEDFKTAEILYKALYG